MESIFTIVIILLNLFGISMLYKMLSGTETSYRIKVVIILAVITFVCSYIVYGISSIGIPGDLKAISKPLLLFTVFPINVMTMAAPIAVLVNKVKSEEIDQDEFVKKLVRMLVIDFVLIIIECIYLKNIQNRVILK